MALAPVVASVIAGTGTDPQAVGFFMTSLFQEVAALGGPKLDVLIKSADPDTDRMGFVSFIDPGPKN